jgi:amino acid permease
MPSGKSSFVRSTLSVIGTVVGAGIFGLPTVFARLGVWHGTLLFLALTGIVLITHLLLVDLVLAEKIPRRMPGLVRRWLGAWGGRLAGIIYPAQIIGADIAYILLGGAFLDLAARQFGLAIHPVLWQWLFWIVMAYTVYRSLTFVSKVEAWATWLLLASLLVLTALVQPQVIHSVVDLQVGSWVLGFGIILFALTGFTVIAEAVELVARNRRKALLAVTLGTLVSAGVSWLFGVRMFAATGGSLTDALAYIQVIPSAWLWLLPVFGFLAVATSFITSTEDFQASLMYDLGWDERAAWGVVVGAPLAISMVLKQEFIAIASFVGAVFVGTSGLLIALSAVKLGLAKKRRLLLLGGVVGSCAYILGVVHAVLQPIL